MWYIDVMNRRALLTVLIFSLLAVSCTHQAERYSVVDEESSIRYAVRKASGEVNWTIPIEPDALSSEPAGMVKNLTFNPSAGFAIPDGNTSVFPVLEEFGSLDTSGMSRAVLSGVQDFLKQLSYKKLTFSSSFFDRPYEGVVILYEASQLPEIKSWTIGKPFIGDGESPSYEVPVLLVTNDGTCTARVYLNPESAAENEVKVQQMMFGVMKKSEQ